MRFAALGPLEVSPDRGPLSLGGRKQRTLLAVLLLCANEIVARDHLIDALWGERPPPSATESLDTYVYRLRKLLGHDRLSRAGGGYVLRVEPGELDVDEFEQLVASAGRAADAGDHGAAVDALTRALALWHGRAWGDMLELPLASVEAQRLEDMRLGAVESRIEAELATGAGAELVPELEQLAVEHPLRERLLAGLMIALYRAGRQTDALDAFRSTRQRLIEELGLEPGPELHELQLRILQHDPTLAPTRHPAPVGASRVNRRRLPVATGVGLIALLIAGSVLLGSRAAGASRGLSPGQEGLVAVDTRSGAVVAAAALGGAPEAVDAAAGSVWVANPGADAVSRIDPETGSTIDRISIGGEPGGIVSGGGAIWVASTVGANVERIDPTTESVTQAISLPGSSPGAITFGDGRVWVADSVSHALIELNPSTGSVERTVALDLQPSAVTIGHGAVWVAGYNNTTVERLDPVTGRLIARVHVGDGPAALDFQDGSLWVANSLDGTVTRIDPATLASTATITVGSDPTALAASGGSVWVADQYSDTVSQIDPRRDRVERSVAVGGAPTSLSVAGDRVWVAVAPAAGSHRGGTLVIESLSSSGPMTGTSIDPAFYSGANDPQFMGLAYDSLVTFQQSPGAAGLRLVPDLAQSIPSPTDHGSTYVFHLRPGIRYSDGQPLRADDLRRAIERLFRVGSIGSSLYAGIAGATVCIRRPRTCDLSRGIETNNTNGTIVFHLTAPDPEFLDKLTEYAYAAPIPPGTPDHGALAVPGTGPYMITTVNDHEVRFVRNPFFREWSHAAQPAGNPDSIVWRTAPSAQAAVTAIEQGRADWLFGQIPTAQYRQLVLQHPAQLHANPLFGVDFIPLNTHLAPFNNLKVRQALNYAIDRAKIVQLYGGPNFATPTCQPVAPGLPGYRRYCPYTQQPRPDGLWSAPDLARARRLVAESGTLGERIEVRGEPDQGYVPPSTTQYVAGVLRTLGYRVRIHLAPTATVTQAMRTHFQLDVDGDWVAVYPDPSSYIPQFFSCNGGNSNGYYCNPRIDHEMQRATQLTLTNPPKARAIWAAVDRQLADNAVWVPTVTPREIELTSSRLHNYQYNPVSGFLADQSWIH